MESFDSDNSQQMGKNNSLVSNSFSNISSILKANPDKKQSAGKINDEIEEMTLMLSRLTLPQDNEKNRYEVEDNAIATNTKDDNDKNDPLIVRCCRKKINCLIVYGISFICLCLVIFTFLEKHGDVNLDTFISIIEKIKQNINEIETSQLNTSNIVTKNTGVQNWNRNLSGMASSTVTPLNRLSI